MKLVYLIIILILIQGCSKEEVINGSPEINYIENKIDATIEFFGNSQKVELINSDSSSIELASFRINNSSYLTNFDVLHEEILKEISEKNKDFPLKAFQYLVEKTYHYTPVTGELFLHHPLYFLNSLGSGYCDDVSSVFSIIMNKYGFKSEVHSLAGHVVSEVTNGNKKELFDVDLRCYYLNRKGEIASYQDLINDPDLIDKPIARLPGADTVAYSKYVRDIYTTTFNNFIDLAGIRYDTLFNTSISIPKGSITFFGKEENVIPVLYNDKLPLVSTALMKIDKGYRGVLNIPLMIIDISGKGILDINGSEMTVEDANDFIDKNRQLDLINKIRVINSEGIRIKLALNAKKFLFRNGLNKFYIKFYRAEKAILKINYGV